MKMMKGLIMCIQFFTSIPIPYEVPMDRRHINMAIKMFPVLGLLQGFLYGILAYALIGWTPLSALAIAFIIWLSQVVITGGIHLDGWMDCSDAFFSGSIMGYHRRSSCVAPASDDRYLSLVLVFITPLAGVSFYRKPIAADDRRSFGAQSGCGIDHGFGD